MSAQVRERLRVNHRPSRTRRVTLGLTPVELIFAVAALILLVGVTVYYFKTLRPEEQRLSSLESELARQGAQIRANKTTQGPETSSPAEMAKLALDSLETFKSRYL